MFLWSIIWDWASLGRLGNLEFMIFLYFLLLFWIAYTKYYTEFPDKHASSIDFLSFFHHSFNYSSNKEEIFHLKNEKIFPWYSYVYYDLLVYKGLQSNKIGKNYVISQISIFEIATLYGSEKSPNLTCNQGYIYSRASLGFLNFVLPCAIALICLLRNAYIRMRNEGLCTKSIRAI